jgi:hypothetical protein
VSNWQLFALFGLLYAICWWISKAVQARVNRFIEPAARSDQPAEEFELSEPKPKPRRVDVLRFYWQLLRPDRGDRTSRGRGG